LTGPETGFLLLTSQLGNPERKPLTTAQMRILSGRVKSAVKAEADRQMQENDLVALGYSREMAGRILRLLEEEQLLRHYCSRGERQGCRPLTWLTEGYPTRVRNRLRDEAPGCLWYKGDLSILSQPKVALVGRRDIREENRCYAKSVGRQAARQGYVLVSGNARGADQAAQRAALEAGGQVISVVADSLQKQPLRRNVLWLSLDDFDQGFSVQRALRRNHIIHTLADLTIAVQCTLEKGGTWDGVCANLQYAWNPVCIFADGSDAAIELENRGVQSIAGNDLQNLARLLRRNPNFLQE
jgi:predicted Rossmann fold nucleotide-binding protein DprA/Smf involved in DNA uptake